MIRLKCLKKHLGVPELIALQRSRYQFPVSAKMPSERSPLARQLRVLMLVVCLVQLADGSELSDKLILDLADGEYRVREKAQSDLLAQARQRPEASKDELFQIAQTSQDPEIRERCLGVLRQLLTDQYMSEGQGFVGIGRMD